MVGLLLVKGHALIAEKIFQEIYNRGWVKNATIPLI